MDVVLGTLNAASLAFGDTSFSNPPASETVKGVIELADSAEALAGTDQLRAMPPARVHEAFNQYGYGKETLLSELDASNWTTPGSYLTPSAGVINLPSGWGQGRHLVHVQGGINYFTQFIIHASGTRAAFRWASTGPAWYEWKELAHSGNTDASLSATSGYQRILGGMIIQGGITGGNATVTFPIAFPNAVIAVMAIDEGSAGNYAIASGPSLTSFSLLDSDANNTGRWMAIGY